MMILYVLLLLVQVASPAKHSLKYFLTATSELTNFPEFVGFALVNEVQVGYCDSTIKTAEPRQDWAKKLLKDDPQHREWYSLECFRRHKSFRTNINGLKQRLNQSEGVHILQRMNGCEWDDETGHITGFHQFGYDGEDFIALDMQTLTWTAPKPQALITKLKWDNEKARIESNKKFLMHNCPDWLKKYLHYGKDDLQKTVRPSVSLLQTSPSSPVSCHATGFYPDRATMFWSKDGEELHEDVDLGEILPNQDGTFQMRVDLDISSVKPEDWTRYDCVFQLYGVKDDITKLKQTAVRTNWVRPSEFPVGSVVGVVVGLMLLSVCVTGLFIWRTKKKNDFLPANENSEDTE